MVTTGRMVAAFATNLITNGRRAGVFDRRIAAAQAVWHGASAAVVT
ncbi:hypothetical protein [Paraburkholderia guartelaensis]|nr:hypothetical protein [Paraburkholderia guartelaensis]